MRVRNESNQRGLDFERRIEKVTRRLLRLDIKRDRQSGAGLNKADIRDRYRQMPIFIECKDQATLKLKEWWREANGKAVVGQSAVVVFPLETEDLAVIRYSDLLQLIREGMDWRESLERSRKTNKGQCPNGHLLVGEYCLWKGCQYGRGARRH